MTFEDKCAVTLWRPCLAGSHHFPTFFSSCHSVVSVELVLWLVVECAEKLAQCSRGFDSFLEFEQKTQILETVVNLSHSVCSVECCSARTAVLLLAQRVQATGKKQRDEGWSGQWNGKWQSPECCAGLASSGKLLAGALKKYLIGSGNVLCG